MIEITVGKQEEEVELIKPSEVYGQPYGRVYQQYIDGEPDVKGSYLISTGHSDRPICIWWDSEDGRYRLSSDSKKELKEFSSCVKFKYLSNAIVTIGLGFDGAIS